MYKTIIAFNIISCASTKPIYMLLFAIFCYECSK